MALKKLNVHHALDETNPHDHLEMEVGITLNRTDAAPEPVKCTWAEMRALMSEPYELWSGTLEEYDTASDDLRKQAKDGAGIVPVKFKDPHGGRKIENIEAVTMIVLDIDEGVTLAEAQHLLQGVESVVHTTFSHTPQNPKLRVYLPLRKPATPIEAKAIFLRMQALFNGRLDSACFDVARMFYLPRCPKDAVGLFRFIHIEGALLDSDAVVRHGLIEAAAGLVVAPESGGTKSANAPSFNKPRIGERNTTLASLVGKWLVSGATEDEALKLAHQWNAELDEPLEHREVEQTVRSIMKTAARKNLATAVTIAEAVAWMNERYVFLKDAAQILRLSDRKIVSKEQMRDIYANCPVNDDEGNGRRRLTTFEVWMQSRDRHQLRNVILAPGEGPMVDDCLNVWRGWSVKPTPGEVKFWHQLLDHLYGVGTPERRYIEQWIACPFQRPGIKMTVAAVLWSARQGIGKSLLGFAVGKLYGPHATTITAQDMYSDFNDWAKDVLLVIGEENSSADRRADTNRLKFMITGTTMRINPKHVAAQEMPNRFNCFFTSNHPDAFHLDKHDRRMFVHRADVEPLPSEFYEDFVAWIESEVGQAALLDHLHREEVDRLRACPPARSSIKS